jgi:hypothetical protein
MFTRQSLARFIETRFDFRQSRRLYRGVGMRIPPAVESETSFFVVNAPVGGGNREQLLRREGAPGAVFNAAPLFRATDGDSGADEEGERPHNGKRLRRTSMMKVRPDRGRWTKNDPPATRPATLGAPSAPSNVHVQGTEMRLPRRATR